MCSAAMMVNAVIAADEEKPVEGDWRFESPILKAHDKAYSAGKFILFPAKEHRFVIVTFQVTATQADPKAVDELASAQKLSNDDKKALRESIKGELRCLDMSKLWLIDANGGRHPALWNTDDTITTSVETLAGTAVTNGRDPAHWQRTKRSAVKLSKEAKEKLIKAGTIDATYPDFRTAFSGLLEVGESVEVSFVFLMPESSLWEGFKLNYGGDSVKPALVFQSGKSTGPSAAAGGTKPQGEPNWQVSRLAIRPYGAAGFSNDQVSINPAQDEAFIEATFQLAALTADSGAVDAFARAWNNADRKSIAKRATSAARIFDARKLALVDKNNKRYPAKWNLDPAVRVSVHTTDIAPNRTSSHSSFRSRGTPEAWIDAEQSFLTRTTRPANGPPIVEQITHFMGIMNVQSPAEVSFLFGVPKDVDHRMLRLEIDSHLFTPEDSVPATTP